MNPTALSLLGFAAWLVLLTFALAFFRIYVAVSWGRPINGFLPDGSDLAGFGRRLTRARNNCFETLPVFGAFVVAAGLMNLTPLLHALAPWILVSRMAQSVTHMISTKPVALGVRALFLGVQLVIYVYWAVTLLGAGT